MTYETGSSRPSESRTLDTVIGSMTRQLGVSCQNSLLSVDTSAALREHGSATLDEHYGRSCQPIGDAGRRCQHQIDRSFANDP